jgi:hypothetical protein
MYAFGVVLLELLTGQCACNDAVAAKELPRWVQYVRQEEWTSEVFDLELIKVSGIEEEIVACSSNWGSVAWRLFQQINLPAICFGLWFIHLFRGSKWMMDGGSD